jgi:Ca2+-binding RTX toxin-like protein
VPSLNYSIFVVTEKGKRYRNALPLPDPNNPGQKSSYYNLPIDATLGRPAGNSRAWGDAPIDVQIQVIDAIAAAGRSHGLTIRETALVLAMSRTESGFNPDAAAGTTTATGVGQFVRNTGKAYGIDDTTRFDILTNADALVRAYLDYKQLAERRGYSGKQEELMIYKYHHDGPKRDYGGLAIAESKVMPLVKKFELALDAASPASWSDILGGIKGLLGKLKSLFYSSAHAATITRRDPLILDLNRDGVIETTQVKDGAYFDHDGDGFAQQTGWASPDDGFLVLDRNGNGIIDDGTELFGDEAILQNGRKAANGFQALSEMDSNADGRIDVNDGAYSRLRVWQDFDGDGYSSDDELFTLDELGIASISTASTISSNTDPQGNTQTRIGSFERTDGTAGQIANFSLQTDRTYTIAREWLDVPDDIAALPDLEGYGTVYDLHQAMVRDASGQLKALVGQFAAASDPATRQLVMEQIIFTWTGVGAVDPASRGPNLDARRLAAIERLFGESFVGANGSNPTVEAALLLSESYRGMVEMYYGQLMAQTHLKPLFDEIAYTWDETSLSLKGDLSAVITTLENGLTADPTSGRQALAEFSRSLRGLGAEDMVNYLSFRESFISLDPDLGWVIDSSGLPVITGDSRYHTFGTDNSEAIRISPFGDGVINGRAGYDVLYGSDSGESLWDESGDTVYVAGGGDDSVLAASGNDLIDGGTGNDHLVGGTGNDFYIFRRGSGQDTIIDTDPTPDNTDTIWLGSNLTPEDVQVRRLDNDMVLVITGTTDQITVRDYFKDNSTLNRIECIQFQDGTVWNYSDVVARAYLPTEGDDIIYGRQDGDDNVQGLGGDDTLYGLGGNDSLSGNAGNDTLYGGNGDDLLNGGSGNDTMVGGSVVSQFNGYTWRYQQVVLDAPNGNDTYLFGRGYGHDTIVDRDSSPANLDTILMKDDILPGDVSLTRSGENLTLSTRGTEDILTVSNWFLGESSDYQVEQIRFADGTTWDTTAIRQLVLQGTPGDDLLYGFSTADTIDGKEGNDVLFGRAGDDVIHGDPGDDDLYGEAGDDVLQGGEGTDLLQGGDGNDILDGGRGSDILIGGAAHYEPDWSTGRQILSTAPMANGNDTYLFGRGYGHDTILDRDPTLGNLDTILLKDDLLPSDVEIRRVDDNLVLSVGDTDDTLTVRDWFFNDSPDYQVEQIRFADGTTWDTTAIKQLVLQGTSGDDRLRGYASDDTIFGLEGNDELLGAQGSDTLSGGAGNDILDGGPGNDTYLFGRGYGEDTIADMDGTAGNVDTVFMAADVSSSDVTLKVGGKDVYVTIRDTTDSLKLSDWLEGDAYKVERIQFADGTVWDNAHMQSLLTTPTETDDYLAGSLEADVLDGGGGNDIIYGFAGNDALYGGPGNDALHGDAGNDTMYGGPGADMLYGGDGDNVFDGGLGDDYLNSGPGEDTFLAKRGGGFDRVDTYLSGSSGSTSSVVFGDGITPDDLSIQATSHDWGSGGEAYLAIGIGNDEGALLHASYSIDSYGGYGGAAPGITDLSVRRFEFADGTVLTIDEILARADSGRIGDQYGTEADETLLGSVANDTIYGNGGNDQIEARDNEDTIYGGEGDDALAAGSGNDTAYGEDGNDIIAGGAGDDVLVGGPGSNIYVFNRGDGKDFVDAHRDLSSGDVDTISFGVNINPGEVTAFRDTDGNLVLTITGSQERITVGGDLVLVQFIDASGSGRIFDLSGITTRLKDSLAAASQDNPVAIFGNAASGFELTGMAPLAGGDYAVAYAQTGDLFAVPTHLFGGPGDDEIHGRDGDDTIDGGDGNNTVYAGMGNDIVTTGSGNDRIVGGAGDDTLFAGAGDDIIDAGPGDDTLLGGAGNNVSIGGPGNDTYVVNDEGDTVIELPGEGTDTVFSSVSFALRDNVENLTLTGITAISATGNDLDNIITGNNADNTLSGGAGNDTYRFGLGGGTDTIIDTSSPAAPNTLVFGPGITPADMRLSHDPEQRMLIISTGNTGDAVCLAGFDPADPLGPHAIEYFQFAGGQILTYEQLVNWGFDIIGGNEADNLIGTAATDRMTGLAGGDTLWSGPGDDTMAGGDGDDTYFFNLGDGIDLIDDRALISSGNTLAFGEGITLADMRNKLSFEDGMFVIRIGDNGDEIHLTGFDPNAADTGPRAVNTYQFADGTMVNYEQLVRNTFILQGDENDNLITGTNLADRLYGYEGFDRLEGGEGSDTLTGGPGNDELIGGPGGDTYVFNMGDGVDTVYDSSLQNGDNLLYFAEGITAGKLTPRFEGNIFVIDIGANGDQLRFPNFDHNDVVGSRAFSAIEFFDGTRLSFEEFMSRGFDVTGTPGDDVLSGTSVIDRITGLEGNDTISAGAGDDTINGGTGNDTIDAGAGNDTIDGGIGDDSLSGGPGADTYIFGRGYGKDRICDLSSTDDTDVVLLGSGITRDDLSVSKNGNDLIVSLKNSEDRLTIQGWYAAVPAGNSRIEQFRFADGSVLTGADIEAMAPRSIRGTDGDDVLYGTADNDVFEGLKGNDTYVVDSPGDVITELPGEGTDTIFSALSCVLPENVENLTLTGTAAVNGMGNELGNILVGNGASNVLDGGAGNDTLDGGPGNDTLTGGAGDDTYLFGKESGNDTVKNNDTGYDTVRYKAGLTLDSLDLFKLDGDSNLYVRIKETGETLKIDGWFAGSASQVDRFLFADGTALTADQVTNRASHGIIGTEQNDVLLGQLVRPNSIYGRGGNDVMTGGMDRDVLDGGPGNDVVLGLEGNDELYGRDGNDTLVAGLGNDSLTGGLGNDTLDGGLGNDTYRFSSGAGNDTLTDLGIDASTQDKALFTGDVLKETIALYRSGQNLSIGYGATDTVTVTNQFRTDYGIEKVELTNGQFLTNGDINKVIQDINAFATSHGIALTSVNDVRNNQDLMTIVSNAWHG